MEPRAQRIAIAKACGWRPDSRNVGRHGALEDGWWHPISGRFHIGNECLPDYRENLNAMHEAEKVLNDDQQWEWVTQIQRTLPKEPHFKALVFRIGTATAAQRAEALLKTLSLWETQPTQDHGIHH